MITKPYGVEVSFFRGGSNRRSSLSANGKTREDAITALFNKIAKEELEVSSLFFSWFVRQETPYSGRTIVEEIYDPAMLGQSDYAIELLKAQEHLLPRAYYAYPKDNGSTMFGKEFRLGVEQYED